MNCRVFAWKSLIKLTKFYSCKSSVPSFFLSLGQDRTCWRENRNCCATKSNNMATLTVRLARTALWSSLQATALLATDKALALGEEEPKVGIAGWIVNHLKSRQSEMFDPVRMNSTCPICSTFFHPFTPKHYFYVDPNFHSLPVRIFSWGSLFFVHMLTP